jgi:hypothetical protein
MPISPKSDELRQVKSQTIAISPADIKDVSIIEQQIEQAYLSSSKKEAVSSDFPGALNDDKACLVGEILCSCDGHTGIQVCDVIFEMDCAPLFELIFAEGGSNILRETHRRRSTQGGVPIEVYDSLF